MSTGAKRQPRARVYPAAYAFFAVAVIILHLPLLSLPFYWDELGQFVPASLDLFRKFQWIPTSTIPNIHPPGLMAYLASFWAVTGYSIEATRIAMLLVAAAAILGTFLLAIEMCRGVAGAPAFAVMAMLLASPLFYAQSMLAQLDLPAMALTTFALLFFFHNRLLPAVVTMTALVLVKETGLCLPFACGLYLLHERRVRQALWFAIPALPLAVWIAALRMHTGSWTGNSDFASYNLLYNLDVLRFILALGRRLYFLFIGSGHIIGTALLIYAACKTRFFASRAWRVAILFAGLHVLMVSAFGGAVLERYLLPVLPLLYIAFAITLASLPKRWSMVALASVVSALVAAIFVPPPYPYPFENNIAFTHFVHAQRRATAFVDENFGNELVAAVFPTSGELRRPEFGYSSRRFHVVDLTDFGQESLNRAASSHPGVLITYLPAWDPWGLLESPGWVGFLKQHYGYAEPADDVDIQKTLGMHKVAEVQEAGQWVHIYATPEAIARSHRVQSVIQAGSD